MILLVHMLFGAAIGSSIANVPLAILLALLGHYFLDLFPHIEYLTSVEDAIKSLKNDGLRKNAKDAIKVLLDFLIGLLLIWIFSKNQPLIYVCALVAIVPDALTVITNLLPNKLFLAHQKLHGGKIHFLKHKKISTFWRILTQVLAAIISIVILKS